MINIIHKVILRNLKDKSGFEAFSNRSGSDKFGIPYDKRDYIFFLEQAEKHFALFYKNYWPNHEWSSPQFINKIAHSKKEGLDKLHKYALEVLEKNKKENSGYDFIDRTKIK